MGSYNAAPAAIDNPEAQARSGRTGNGFGLGKHRRGCWSFVLANSKLHDPPVTQAEPQPEHAVGRWPSGGQAPKSGL
jgi:hypothetical protein